MAEKVTLTLPSGETIEHTPPKIPLRTSTKVAGIGGLSLIATAGAMFPLYDQANALILQACQSEHGPAAVLLGMGGMLALNWFTARVSKSPLTKQAL